jgi:hypothetical protein
MLFAGSAFWFAFVYWFAARGGFVSGPTQPPITLGSLCPTAPPVSGGCTYLSWFPRYGLRSPLGVLPDRIADSSSIKAVSFSSACTTKRFPSSRCASAIQIVLPLESIAETQSQLQPALLRLSPMISDTLLNDFAPCGKLNPKWRTNHGGSVFLSHRRLFFSSIADILGGDTDDG